MILCLCCSKLSMAPHCLKDKIQTPTVVFKTLHQLTLPVLPPQHAFTHLTSQGHQELTVPTPRPFSAGPAPPSPISTYRGPFECFDGVWRYWQLCPCLPLPQNCNLLKHKDHSRDLLLFELNWRWEPLGYIHSQVFIKPLLSIYCNGGPCPP